MHTCCCMFMCLHVCVCAYVVVLFCVIVHVTNKGRERQPSSPKSIFNGFLT